jgi:hypothetical protein
MAAEGKIKLIAFPERDKLMEMTAPVREAYATEVGAQEVYARINALR